MAFHVIIFRDRRCNALHKVYSAAELSRLIEAANAVCEQDSKKPELVVLRRLSSA